MDWVAIAVKETFDSIAKAQRRNAELETKLLSKDSKPKYKIRYQDTMTTYLIDGIFDSEEDAEEFIDLNLGESSCYRIEENEDE